MTKQLVQSAIWAAVIAIHALVVLGCGSTTSAGELGTQEQPRGTSRTTGR